MNIVQTIREAIDRYDLLPEDRDIVAGVSGGADSIALMHAFHILKIPVIIAHLNHQLRGTESDFDEQFVQNLAAELGFQIIGKSVDVRQLAEVRGLSVEMAARQARHDFFMEFASSVIALGHHADDQAETFLLRLARSTGSEGLGGMPPVRDFGALRIIRPMLDIPRSNIIQWLKENRFSWREDTSNADESFLRNKVRHVVLPMLKQELNPNICKAILQTMNIIREENEWMDRLLHNCVPEDPLPLAAKRRLLRKWLFCQGAAEAGFHAVEQIISLMETGKGTGIFELNSRQRVVVEYGKVRFERNDFRPPETAWKLTLKSGYGWRKDHGKGAGILPAEASFNAGKIDDSPIKVRGWLPGDRIAPLGMKGSRKLQDILTDQKVPRSRRLQIPVITCLGEVIWVPGYRIAHGWEVCGEAGRAVHVRVEQSRIR